MIKCPESLASFIIPFILVQMFSTPKHLIFVQFLFSFFFLRQLFESEEEDEGVKGEERVRLTRLYQFARNVRALLHTYHYNQIFLTEFWGAFSKYMGREFQTRDYGCSTLDELLAAIPQVSSTQVCFSTGTSP